MANLYSISIEAELRRQELDRDIELAQSLKLSDPDRIHSHPVCIVLNRLGLALIALGSALHQRFGTAVVNQKVAQGSV